jgi:hypothetical protein
MVLRELIGIYCENHTEHIHKLCAQNAGGTYTHHLALNVNVRINTERNIPLRYTSDCTGIISVFHPKGALHTML